MKLTVLQIAEIICGAQDQCMHRKTGAGAGVCGDCRCPAKIIDAIENGTGLVGEDIELALDGNHPAQKIIARL